ncbi:NAD-dependent SIR2 family protein deacetylase [Mucilaginibacter sp. UYNi724]
MIEKAARICAAAEIFILVGTSLAVYPAAGLINYLPRDVTKYIIDPNIPTAGIKRIVEMPYKATVGVPLLVEELMKNKS